MELSAFTNLFQNLQDYVVGILNSDEILQQMGCTFLAENSLDIEYQIRDALNKQGMACVVMTPKATYQGHNGIQQTFTCDELTIQIVENPIINRARLKKAGLEHGTALDVAKQASDRLAGPQGGYFGQFTTKKIQEAEQGGLLVCTATFGCTVYEKLDAVISGDLSGNWVEVPFVRTSELSDYIDDYLSTHMPAMDGYLPLSTTTTQTLQITGGNNSGWEFLDANNNPMLRIDEYGTYANKRLDIYGELYYQNQALSDYVESKIPSVPTKVSELSNDVGYITSAQVEPAELRLGNSLSGYALKAWQSHWMMPSINLGLRMMPLGANDGYLYLLYNDRLHSVFNVPYDWSLSSFQGTQFSPPITMKYNWWPERTVRVGHRIQRISRGWGWNGNYNGTDYFIHTAEELSAGYVMPSTQTPDRFYVIGTTSYSLKPITLTDNQLSIATYDGQTGVMECARLSAGMTQKYNAIPYLDEVVPYYNTSALTITVPYDYGFSLQTPNGTPLLKTIDLNRTTIASLSAGSIETGSDVVKYPEAGVEPTSLSAWNWIKTRDTGLGTIIQNQHDAILGEVSEDYVAYNWLIQQGYATSAQVNEALSNYLPLSGGQMTGSIRWDYGGLGGPMIYGPYNPQALAFTTTYAPDADKMVFLDFSRISEATGQRTIAFVEDIDAVLGDISALIHAT